MTVAVAADRAGDFPQSLPLAANRGPVYLIGTGESVETPMGGQKEDFTSSRAFRITGAKAFAEARTTHQEFYSTGSRGGCRGHQAGQILRWPWNFRPRKVLNPLEVDAY